MDTATRMTRSRAKIVDGGETTPLQKQGGLFKSATSIRKPKNIEPQMPKSALNLKQKQAIEIPDTQDREDKDQDKAPKSPSQTEEPGPVQMDILPFTPVAEVRQHSADPQEDCVDDAMLISPAMPLTQQVTPAVADMAMLEGSGVTPQQPALEFSFDTAISREIASPEAFEPILGAPAPPSSGPFLVSSQAAVTPKAEVIVAPQRTPKVTSKTPTITPAPRSSVATAKPALTPFRATSCRTTPAGAAAKHTPVASALGASTPAASASKQRPSSATTMAPGATLRTPTAKASATATASVSAVRPASAAPRSSLRVSSSVGPVTSAETKRVSICSPLPASAARALSASRPLVCTPHPKSGKGETPGPEEAMDIDDVSNSPAPTAVAALSPAPPAALSFGVTDVDGMGDGPDAAMLLAAALPPSSRTTAEETVLAEHPPDVAAGAMEEVDVVAASMIMQAATLSPEESMEIDTAHPLSVEAAAEQSVIPASVQLGTPGPVIAHAPAVITPSFTGGFTATMPKLTFPVSTASYMSGTKSSAMKTASIAAGAPEALPASSYKPRVKSMVVGNKGDDRSIKQLKREIKATLQAKAEERQKSIKGLEPEDENQEAPYNKVDEDMLVAAMQTKTAGLGAKSSGGLVELRGLPRPQGTHLRFSANGEAVPSPDRERTHLKGVPAPKGSHMRFNS